MLIRELLFTREREREGERERERHLRPFQFQTNLLFLHSPVRCIFNSQMQISLSLSHNFTPVELVAEHTYLPTYQRQFGFCFWSILPNCERLKSSELITCADDEDDREGRDDCNFVHQLYD